MIISTLMYALFTTFGILGIGHLIWNVLKNRVVTASDKNGFQEHFLLTVGISWFLGYFVYESILYLLAVSRLFYPIVIISTGCLLNIIGIRRLFLRVNIKAVLQKFSITQYIDIAALIGMGVFLFFWNLYPSMDIDSNCYYFASVKNWIENRGLNFSPFQDIRLSLPLGENILYALGFAWRIDSAFFPQVIRGIYKVMIILIVYGAAKSLRLGAFSLIAAALIVAEEHFVASGANRNVILNLHFMAALFFIFYGLFVSIYQKEKSFLLLAFYSACVIVMCKYFGLVYGAIFFFVLIVLLMLHRSVREDLKAGLKGGGQTYLIILLPGVMALIPYIANLLHTGSPIFPASLGPFVTGYYDATASQVGKMWHYHLSVGDALKNFSAFMVWPGILALKILAPLFIFVSLTQIIFLKKPDERFLTACYFVIVSILIVLIQESFFVYEMRYYRFGIMAYAMSCALLLAVLFNNLADHFKIPGWLQLGVIYPVVLLICVYCMKDSFDVMGVARPSAQQIREFLTYQKSEEILTAERFKDAHKQYDQLDMLKINPEELGIFIEMSWPRSVYPVQGRELAFLKTAAMPSHVYFNEGLLAEELNRLGIKYIFNRLVYDDSYPLPGGAVHALFKECGRPVVETHQEFIELSSGCLEKVSLKKDLPAAHLKLKQAMEQLKNRPQYEPFNKPDYGGIPGIIR